MQTLNLFQSNGIREPFSFIVEDAEMARELFTKPAPEYEEMDCLKITRESIIHELIEQDKQTDIESVEEIEMVLKLPGYKNTTLVNLPEFIHVNF